MAKTLYIIDGHAHIYAAYYAPMRGRLTSPAGEPTKATYIFTTAMLKLINEAKPDMLIVAMDSKEPSFRTKIYKEYKAHRPPMPDDMPVQIGRIEEILEAMNIPMLRCSGFEADDLIGTIATKASAKGIDVYICSKDKDMLQLLDKHVKTYDIKTGEITNLESMKKDMNMTPEQFIDVLALQGDTSDNIPGVPDVGPKTALEWIQQYGSIDNLYKHADEIKGKRGDNLRASAEVVELSKELVKIDRNAPVDINQEKFAVKKFDNEALAEIFTELDFVRLMTQLGLHPVTKGTEKPAKIIKEQTSVKKNAKGDYELIDTPGKFDKFLSELKKQRLFAVDTETTAINAMRADLVGMSFSWEAGKGYYLPVRAPLGTSHLELSEIKSQLAPILADEKIKKIGQNIKYDLLVLRNAGMPLGGIYFDTMVASYCLDPLRRSHGLDSMAEDFLDYECIGISALIGKGKNQLTFDMVDTEAACEYAAEDADITFRLYEYLKEHLEEQPEIKKLFEEVEMPLVAVLAEMEYNGVSLDVQLLKKMSGRLESERKEISEKIFKEAGTVFNIDSPKQLAEILFDRLGLESIEVGKTGRSTDAGVLEELSEQHPIADLALQYRQISKLQNTYVDKLGTLINPRTNRVHASFNQTVTVTGRLSSSNPNLQNIPIRTDLGRQIREAFVPAEKNDYLLSADYSQIELRLLAHFSKDKELCRAFAEDKDIHSFVASQIFDVPIDEVTRDMRSRCKAVNFGLIYGQGAFGLSRTIGISQAEAKEFIEGYFARYSSIKDFMCKVIEDARKSGYAETILGRRRKILNLNSKNSLKRSQAERLAVNTTIQGSAADLIKVAMINIQRRIESEDMPVKMILQIHDELVFEVPSKEAKKHSKWISEEMTGAIRFDVPLKVDVTCGASWLGKK
ncbi:MAG: DNA polymerase I [Sedimentisphaerales bacterium]|nr:DNA polymerase I [Sedimentisphaerales bacterium]